MIIALTSSNKIYSKPTVSVAVEHIRSDISLSKPEKTPQNSLHTPTREENNKKK